MKTAIVLLSLIAAVPVHASTPTLKLDLRLDRLDKKVVLATMPVLAAEHLLLHEATHATALRLQGVKCHHGWGPRTFNGGTQLAWVESEQELSTTQAAWFYAAPRLVDLAIIGTTSLVMKLFRLPEWAHSLLWSIRSVAFADFAFGTVGIFAKDKMGNDAWGLARNLKLDTKTARTTSVVALTLTTAIMVW